MIPREVTRDGETVFDKLILFRGFILASFDPGPGYGWFRLPVGVLFEVTMGG